MIFLRKTRLKFHFYTFTQILTLKKNPIPNRYFQNRNWGHVFIEASEVATPSGRVEWIVQEI